MGSLEKIVVVGGGGHAKVVIEMIRGMGQFEICGLLDPELEKGSKVLDAEVLGGDELLPQLKQQGVSLAAVGIGSWGDNELRQKIFENLRRLEYALPTLIHPSAILSEYIMLGVGVQVMAGAIIQPNVVIEENSVINSGNIIEHDCRIGKNLYTGSRVTCSGFVTIGNNCFIGSGATIIPQITIEHDSFVAAGAVVTENIRESQKVKGIPAKVYY